MVHGEANSFNTNSQKNMIELTGQNIDSRTERRSLKMESFLLILAELGTITIIKVTKHKITL